jgi:hypothetical protein
MHRVGKPTTKLGRQTDPRITPPRVCPSIPTARCSIPVGFLALTTQHLPTFRQPWSIYRLYGRNNGRDGVSPGFPSLTLNEKLVPTT